MGGQAGFEWSSSFFLVPLETAAVVTAIAWGRAKKRRGPALVVWSWGIGAPIGVAVWVAFWNRFGGGTGVPDGSTIGLAICFWLLWVLGLHQHSSPGRRGAGRTICATVVMALIVLRLAMPRGTSLLALEIDAALLGLLPYWLVKSVSSRPESLPVEPHGMQAGIRVIAT